MYSYSSIGAVIFIIIFWALIIYITFKAIVKYKEPFTIFEPEGYGENGQYVGNNLLPLMYKKMKIPTRSK